MFAGNRAQLATLSAMAVLSLNVAAQPILPATQGIDPNTFIVGHPASPRWIVVHAGSQHPAVLQVRAAQAGINANKFIVQPPASVTWLVSGEESRALVAAASSLPGKTAR